MGPLDVAAQARWALVDDHSREDSLSFPGKGPGGGGRGIPAAQTVVWSNMMRFLSKLSAKFSSVTEVKRSNLIK